MSNRGLPKNRVPNRAVKNDRRLSLRKLLARVGLCLGAVVLAAAVFILIFGGMILNRYGKGKMERAYAKAHPGGALHIGKFDYSVGADRLVAQTVTLSVPPTCSSRLTGFR